MDVYAIVEQFIIITKPTRKTELREPLAYNNAMAHSLRAILMTEDGEPADLTGVGVTASFVRSDGETVEPINGTASGNVAEVILPESCYIAPGRFTFTMNLTKAGGYTRTIMWVNGYVERNATGKIVDPGTPVGNITQAIGNANAAASSANDAASNANTAATSAGHVNIVQNKSGKVITITTTDKNNVSTSKTIVEPDVVMTKSGEIITITVTDADGTTTATLTDPVTRMLLLADMVPGTTQKPTFSAAGVIQQIVHEGAGGTAVRTDVITRADTAVTETRTLATGQKMTITTNKQTKQTSVVYSDN